jgi:hypothetical protein
MEQLGSHWTDFYEILYLSIFRNSVERTEAWLISDKNNGYVTKMAYTHLWYLAEFFS